MGLQRDRGRRATGLCLALATLLVLPIAEPTRRWPGSSFRGLLAQKTYAQPDWKGEPLKAAPPDDEALRTVRFPDADPDPTPRIIKAACA